LSTLERAIVVAAEAHAGQKDKAGAPYILHPLRVMLAMEDDEARMAAVLHDVVEDSGVTLDQLREMGFPESVVEAVDALTKRDDERGADNYLDFVVRAGRNDIARTVKLADIADNMDLSRIAAPTGKDLARVNRYRRATTLLERMQREAERGVRATAPPSSTPSR
jgi:(p)ppGpp synthase/HD superfamily hydrolase